VGGCAGKHMGVRLSGWLGCGSRHVAVCGCVGMWFYWMSGCLHSCIDGLVIHICTVNYARARS
jgi:hypothetical protein